MEKIFKYGGLEAPFDSGDYLALEKLEGEMEKVQEKIAESGKAGKASQVIRAQVETICDLFDGLFGEGAGNKALGGTTSLDDAMAAMMALVDHVNIQREARTAMVSKYAPNRAQRRAAK